MDITLIVALIASSITAISAIVAPVLTALITTRHEYKIKTIELFFHAKLNAYNKFIEVSSTLPSNPHEQDLQKLHNATAYASLLSSATTRSKISAYSYYLIQENFEQIDLAYESVILAMQDDLYEFRGYRKNCKKHNHT